MSLTRHRSVQLTDYTWRQAPRCRHPRPCQWPNHRIRHFYREYVGCSSIVVWRGVAPATFSCVFPALWYDTKHKYILLWPIRIVSPPWPFVSFLSFGPLVFCLWMQNRKGRYNGTTKHTKFMGWALIHRTLYWLDLIDANRWCASRRRNRYNGRTRDYQRLVS